MALPEILRERRRTSSGWFPAVFVAVVLVLTAATALLVYDWQSGYERDWAAATLRTVTVVHGQEGEGSCRVTVRVPGLAGTRTSDNGPCGLRPGSGVGAWVSPAGRVFFSPPPASGVRQAQVWTAAVRATVVAVFGWSVLLGVGLWLWGRIRFR